MTTSPETWRALRQDAALLRLEHRGVVLVRGADGPDLLHRVTSQDTEHMEIGAGAPACVLTAKGKLLAFFELYRIAEDCFLAEIDREQRQPLRDLLDRFIFAEQIELELPEWSGVGVFGPRAAEQVADAPPPGSVRAEGNGWLLANTSLAVPGITLHGPPEEIESFAARHDLPAGGAGDWNDLRIDAGIPRYGVDPDDSTIPLEANLDVACHPDKGCYIGQEVIARIHTYGHVNRKLCRLHIEAEAVPEAGTLVYDEEVEAGRVTSGYVSPEDGSVHALAMLPRVLAEPGTEVRVGAADGSPARVV